MKVDTFKSLSLHTFLTKAKGRKVSPSVNTLSMCNKGKRLAKTTFSMQQCTRKNCRHPIQSLPKRRGVYANACHLMDHSHAHNLNVLYATQTVQVTLTGGVSSTVSVLLQNVALQTAAAMRAYAVLTQLVTHTPHGAVIKIFNMMESESKQIRLNAGTVDKYASTHSTYLISIAINHVLWSVSDLVFGLCLK